MKKNFRRIKSKKNQLKKYAEALKQVAEAMECVFKIMAAHNLYLSSLPKKDFPAGGIVSKETGPETVMVKQQPYGEVVVQDNICHICQKVTGDPDFICCRCDQPVCESCMVPDTYMSPMQECRCTECHQAINGIFS